MQQKKSAVKEKREPWYRVRVRAQSLTGEGNLWLGFVLRGIFKEVCKHNFTFHARGGGVLPRRQEEGGEYALHFFVTNAGRGDVERAMEHLGVWRGESFRMKVEGEVEERTIEMLEEERGGVLEGLGEVVLEMHSPLVRDEVELLGGEKVGRLLEARCKHVLGSAPRKEGNGLEAISWFLRGWKGESRMSKSQQGHRETVVGESGPLFLRGDVGGWKRELLLAEELHFGRSLSCGAGHFSLLRERKVLDAGLKNGMEWVYELRKLQEDRGRGEEWHGPRAPGEIEVVEMAEAAGEGKFAQEPAGRIRMPKADGDGVRMVGKLGLRTYLFHRVLAQLLRVPLERRLHESAIAYRQGRSVENARPFLAHAMDEGYTHMVKADVRQFFDEISWGKLGEVVGRFLSYSDPLMRGALEAAWTLPYKDGGREAGVLQGSPLSPSLANLFLTEWDEAMAGRGHRHLRYGDDLLIAAKGEDGAREVLRDAEVLLGNYGLKLKEEKTAILSVADGFRHLGLHLGGDDGDILETAKPALRRTLYLTKGEDWAGLEHGALTLRNGTKLVKRLPLLQISNIVFMGGGGVSSGLVEGCMSRGIALSFGNRSGHHCATLHPEGSVFYKMQEAHSAVRRGMKERAVAQVARSLVEQKLEGFRIWGGKLQGEVAGEMRDAAQKGLDSLRGKEKGVPEVLGVEGASARRLFRAVNSLCVDPFWRSERRLPHERRDAWNALLDTISFLLFTRLNFLLRSAGLNPFLGFLHSPGGRFESLVCDLQEPFRARVERLAVRMVNWGILQAKEAVLQGDNRWSWTAEGWKSVVLEFETELDRRRGSEEVTWRVKQEQWVDGLRLWVLNPNQEVPWLGANT